MAQYYVANGGDDGGAGTILDPWENIAGKIDQGNLSTGDEAYLNKGDWWTSNTIVKLDGERSYGAYGTGDNPRLYGGHTVSGWTVESGTRYQATRTGGQYAANSFLAEIQSDGTITLGTRQADLVSVTDPGDYYFDFSTNTLYYIATDEADPDDHTIQFQFVGYNTLRLDGDDGTLDSWDIFFGARTTASDQPSVTTSGWDVSNCRFAYGNLYGFEQFSDGGSQIDFAACEFDHNVLQGMSWSGYTNSTVTTSNFHHNNPGTDSYTAAFSFASSVVDSGNVISYNDFTDNGGGGAGSKTGGTGSVAHATIVEHCYFARNGANSADNWGLKTFDNGVIFRFNLSEDNCLTGDGGSAGLGGGIGFDHGANNCFAYYNITLGNAGANFNVTGEGHSIFNNVLFGAVGETVTANEFLMFNTTTDLDNTLFKNNIVVSAANGRVIKLNSNVGTFAGLTLDYNCYHTLGAKPADWIHWHGTSYQTLAAFRSGESQEANGKEADPLLVDPDNGDFRILITTSPCYQAGVDVGLEGENDYYGNTVPATPSIGANDPTVYDITGDVTIPPAIAAALEFVDFPSAVAGLAGITDVNSITVVN